jgi:hypothetical protein
VTRTSRGSDPTLQELLAFERLLSNLSARLANVTVDRVVGEIEDTLNQLIKLLGFDRGTFMEIADGEKQSYLCSAAVKGIEPRRGPVPDDHSWFIRELRAGRTIVIRSYEEIPPEAAASVEYFRQSAFVLSWSFRCLLVATLSRRLALVRVNPRGTGPTISSRV